MWVLVLTCIPAHLKCMTAESIVFVYKWLYPDAHILNIQLLYNMHEKKNVEILCSHQRIAQLCWNVKINETNLLYLKNILCSFQVSMLFIWFSNSYESPLKKKNKTKQNKKNTKKQNEKEKTLLSHLGPVVCKTLPFSHLCRQLQKVSKNPIFSDLCIRLNSDTPSLFTYHTTLILPQWFMAICTPMSVWADLDEVFECNFFFLICSAHFVSWLDGQKCFEFFIIFCLLMPLLYP